MAADLKPAYQDPSLQILGFLQNMGGTKTSGTTTSASPAAISGLQGILNTQMGSMTPEGATALINSIFSEGLKQVPALQHAYGNAVGARTTNNSPLAIGIGDLQATLAQKAMQQIQTQQANAAMTANALAGATKTTSGTTTKPANNSLMLLPFLAQAAGKFKTVRDLLHLDPSTAPTSGIGSFNLSGMGSPGVGYGITPGIDFSAGGAGLDFSAPITGGADASFAPGIDFSAGLSGLGDTSFLDSASTLPALTGGDFGNVDPDFADAIFGSDFSFANGGLVSRKKGKKVRTGSPNSKPKGYADGGQVQGVDTRYSQEARMTPNLRGVTYSGLLGDPTLAIPGMNNPTVNPVMDIAYRMVGDPEFDNSGEGPSGEGEGIATGAVGTPGQNAAAIGGALAAGLGLATGIPAGLIGLGMSAFGVPNSPMNPISALLSHAMAAFSGDSAAIASGDVAAPGVQGMSTPGAMGSGMSVAPGLTSNPIDDAIAAMVSGSDGLGGGNDGTAAEGSGIGGTGNSAGDGEGGVTAANGGKATGPGSGTSDDINVNVSDGEYILPADTVEFFGVPMLDMMRAISHQWVMPQQQQQPSRAKEGAR